MSLERLKQQAAEGTAPVPLAVYNDGGSEDGQEDSDDESDDGKPVTRVWAYPGERTTRVNAQQRCASLGKTLCAAWTTKQDTGVDFSEELAWRLGDCAFQVQIDSEGLINVIHRVEEDPDDGGALQPADEWELQVDSGDTYRGVLGPAMAGAY